MNQSKTTLWLFAGAAVVLIAGLAIYWTRMRGDGPSPPSETTAGSDDSPHVFVYQIDPEQELLIPRRLNVSGASDEQARQVLEELVRFSNDEQNAQSAPLPPQTSFHTVAVSEDTVTIDFGEHFRNPDFWAGSEHEFLALQALVNSLTEIRGIRRVLILVGGKSIESLGGHMEVSEPLERDESIIAKRDANGRDLAHRDPGARDTRGQP